MRLYLLGFCLLFSLTISAQSIFDENMISGDNLREMISVVFESREGQTIQEVDAVNGQEIVLLINSKYSSRVNQQDVRNALIDFKSSPSELDLSVSVRIFDEGEMSQTESLRAIRIGLIGVENRITLQLSREDIFEKKQYRLNAFFEKSEEEWILINQNLTIRP